MIWCLLFELLVYCVFIRLFQLLVGLVVAYGSFFFMLFGCLLLLGCLFAFFVGCFIVAFVVCCIWFTYLCLLVSICVD